MFCLPIAWFVSIFKSGIRYASNAMGKSTPTKIDANANIMQVKPMRRLSIQQETMITLSPKRTLSSAQAITSSNPDNLPHLPLPKLEDTMQKYLKSVQPLLSSEKFLKTAELVEDFKRGIGAQLHDLLEYKASKSQNWLADWWLTIAYLSWRSPVVIWSNPGLYLPTRFFENDFQWCRFTARCIWATLRYKQMIDYNEIPTEKAGKYPLDMSQYKKIFGTCRIPAPEVDHIEYNPKSKHIVVAFKNGYYKVTVYEESSDKFLSENQLTEQLLLILKDSGNNEQVGLLTTEHRDTLATAYENLTQDAVNKASVDAITKSLFVVCLDQPIPVSDPNEDFNLSGSQLIHGGGSKQNSGNRWFNKTLQLIVNRNGMNGINYEHSPAEGQPIAVLTDFILKQLKMEASENEIINAHSFPHPTKLPFNISEKTQKDIQIAAENIDKASSNLELNVVHFKTYGKNFIKSQRMSPDSFIQMAMQYAFYKLHGEPGAHYETAQVRMFIHGRTETIRSCSTESVAFAEAMCDPAVSNPEKVQLLRAAVQAHKNYTVMASSGEGIDRHLLGLKLIAREKNFPIPELYNDEAYVKSTSFRISTSQVASNAKSFMCYGPAVDDGYGICYNPRNDDIILAVSAIKSNPVTSAKAMGQHLTDAFEHMHRLLSKAGERRLSKL
ncbi:carnitine O-acetyltransferase-like isoform X3 [Sitodiplosis mosellana]|uniref:carnitine O-acetyltransferase-like isoform X3 n=1 Tax=Sitodiplosis mosellana TaxID=263140 RepID=UPI0024449A45|nr:carnitine O-acetyltransferase-like isoform X3 [Sitodiplosis mosellana]